MIVNGTKYQIPCALVVGQSDEDEDLPFGHVLGVLVHDCKMPFLSPTLHNRERGRECLTQLRYSLPLSIP